jgi:hypothetical protein
VSASIDGDSHLRAVPWVYVETADFPLPLQFKLYKLLHSKAIFFLRPTKKERNRLILYLREVKKKRKKMRDTYRNGLARSEIEREEQDTYKVCKTKIPS